MQDNWDNYDNLPQESKMESDKSDSDTDYKPKIENKAKKNHVRKVTKPKFSRPEKPKIDSKDIDETIKAETKSDIKISPNFKNAKNLRNPDDIFLYPYVKYISETELQCLCCDTYTHRVKARLFRHLRTVHKAEINWNKEPEKINDCKTRACEKLYGFLNKEMWCIQCSEIAKIKRKESQRISKEKQKNKVKERKLCMECGKNVIDLRDHIKTVHENKKRESRNRKKRELCPECGKYVNFLKNHMKTVHVLDRQKCPHCNKELKNTVQLYKHIKQYHSEKLPCTHCGKLFTSWNMKRHIERQHTSNDDKKYKCDVCGKGFARKEHLPDHKNIHTGEKPYKCKFCSACFASRGNHNIHERSHLGYKRKSSK